MAIAAHPFRRDSLPRRIGSICVSSNTKHRSFPVADAQVKVASLGRHLWPLRRCGVPSQAVTVTSRRKTKNGTTRSNVPFALANSQLNPSNSFSIVCPDNAAHSNASPCLLTPPLFTTVVSVSLSSFFSASSCSVPTKKVTHGKAQEEAGLANAGISDEYKLEEVVVIPLPPGGLGRGGWGHRCLLWLRPVCSLWPLVLCEKFGSEFACHHHVVIAASSGGTVQK